MVIQILGHVSLPAWRSFIALLKLWSFHVCCPSPVRADGPACSPNWSRATEEAVHGCNFVLWSLQDYIQGLVIVPHLGKERVIHRHEVDYLHQQLYGLYFQQFFFELYNPNIVHVGPHSICKSLSFHGKNNLHKNKEDKKEFAHKCLLSLLGWITSRGLPILNL